MEWPIQPSSVLRTDCCLVKPKTSYLCFGAALVALVGKLDGSTADIPDTLAGRSSFWQEKSAP
jgi:hypothetical protein